MERYWVMDRNTRGRWIAEWEGDDEPSVDWYYWRRGAPLPASEVVPDPIRFSLEPLDPHSADDSPHLPSYLRAAAPLFRQDLVAALRSCGVDCLDARDVALHDPDSGQVLDCYKVVNITCMRSVTALPALVDVDVDARRQAVAAAPATTALMFRLAESSNAILVHCSVRDGLLARGFHDLAFYDALEVAV